MSEGQQQQSYLDRLSETLIGWQCAFEEPIFQFINEKRINGGGIQSLNQNEQEYFKYETDTFKMEMFATAFVFPINFFTLMYHREDRKLFKSQGKLNFYHRGAITTLVPCIIAFGCAIYRRNFVDSPHEKALTSKYYYELKKYESN